MGLFRRPAGPTRINQVQLNQSNQGYPVPVLMGSGKIQQTLLWLDGFKSKRVSVSGGKGFGGKNGSQYEYSADLLAGLCDGGDTGVLGIGDVWSGQSWLRNSRSAETYDVSGASPSYTPANADSMTGDHGVYVSASVSGSYNDLAATEQTNINVTMPVPLQRVAYVSGQTPADGTYAVDDANTYYFSPGDAGKSVTINYSFSLKTVSRQQIALIPSGLNVAISGDLPFTADIGVIYYSTGTDTSKNGQRLTRVSGTPTVAGTYSVDYGSYTVTGKQGSETVTVNRAASYTFASADVGQEVQLTYSLNDGPSLPAGTQTSLSFELIRGTSSDPTPAILLTNFPSAALAYPRIAKVLYTPMDLGYAAQIQQNTFEVITEDIWGGGIPDCNPVRCILKVLTDAAWGLGAGPIPFPTDAIDNASGGTWGTASPAGVAQSGSTAANWFAANSFFITPALDRQDTAASLIGQWLEAGMCAVFMSEGLMKLVPYGDTSAAGNGATWIAPSAFAAELDDTCYKRQDGKDPVKISSSPWTEGFNTVQIGWSNRENQYATELTPTFDQSAINRYGSRIEDPQSWDFITTLAAARFAGSIRLKRNVYTRNTYEFTLPFRFSHLEPMDVISITTNSAWNVDSNNTIQLKRCPARITKIVDNPDGTYDVTCEDLISGAHTPDGFDKATANPAPAPNQFADPGDTVPIFLDAPLDLKIYDGNELWIGAAGNTQDWGGCYVYASSDGDKYKPIGTIKVPARLGTLASAFPAGADPDTADSLVVLLQPDSPALEAGTQTDADNANTLCYVDGELLAYSAATISGTDQYTLSSYLRRGLMGTEAAAHAQGSKFLRLDDAVFRYAYDASWIGKTIYLKFQSFNSFGNSAQDLSSLTAYTFTPSGVNYPPPPVVTVSQSSTYSGAGSATASNGLVDAGSGLASVATVYVTVTWTWPANYPTPSGFNVALFEGTDPAAVDQYIAPIAGVGASARNYTFAVTPSSEMTNVNAAVEAVYA